MYKNILYLNKIRYFPDVFLTLLLFSVSEVIILKSTGRSKHVLKYNGMVEERLNCN